jgi:hypothetical protein
MKWQRFSKNGTGNGTPRSNALWLVHLPVPLLPAASRITSTIGWSVPLIAESYDLMKQILGLSVDEMAEIFKEWNEGELDCPHIQSHYEPFLHNVQHHLGQCKSHMVHRLLL